MKIPQQYFDKVKKFHRGDDKKTWEWFTSLHPSFGMITPLNAIKLGKAKKVTEFIDKNMR